MTIDAILRHGTFLLESAGIATARLDCLVLLEDLLNTNRTQILAHPDTPITNEQEKVLSGWLKRRAAHEPLAYIRKKSEFYGREFYVDERVLEPRPESEAIIDGLRTIVAQSYPLSTIIDVGTGSGALAITAKLDCPSTKVIGLDIDASCLVVARKNASKFAVDIEFLQSNLLNKLRKINGDCTAFLANLPYVPDGFHINTAASHEPRRAIFGGPDGLSLYRNLFQQLAARDKQGTTFVLTESLPPQHSALAAIAKRSGYTEVESEDFVQVFRRLTGSSGSSH